METVIMRTPRVRRLNVPNYRREALENTLNKALDTAAEKLREYVKASPSPVCINALRGFYDDMDNAIESLHKHGYSIAHAGKVLTELNRFNGTHGVWIR